ncbi:MAG: GNAT family N-acetyltransferase [Rubrobacteraceae bacterium]
MKPAVAETLLIRRYGAADHEAVLRLHKIVLRHAGVYAEGHEDELDGDLDDIDTVYLRNNGEFLVGVHDDRVVAMGALRRTSDERAEIKRMRVAPALQGRGFGQEILTALEERAAELDYTKLHLDTTTRQRAARHLYAKNGYCEVRRAAIGLFEGVFFERNLVG